MRIHCSARRVVAPKVGRVLIIIDHALHVDEEHKCENYFVLSCANASSQVYVMYIVYANVLVICVNAHTAACY